MINKNDVLELNIESLGINGEGVAKHDGAVIFVPFALPNEKVIAKIIFSKSKFYVAKIVEILQVSPNRITPPCPYFTKCGGCNLQHLNYLEQLNFKTTLVKNNFKNIAKLDVSINNTIASNFQFNYRNKFSFPVGIINNKPVIGMYKNNSHEIIPINNCLIQQEWAKNVIDIFNVFLQTEKNSIYNEQTKLGLIKHLVCRMVQNQLIVCVVINGNSVKHVEFLIKLLSQKFSNFGLCVNINKLNNNVILTNNYVHLHGLKNISIIENDIKYEVNINSFMQVNSFIANKIYSQVASEVCSEIVVNAYSGAGYLTALLSKTAKHVYGIEIVESAHKNAQQLISNNNIKNVTNICGDVSEELSKINQFNTIVLDPPRKGCDKKVIETINKIQPNKIIYISCDSATLCRDLTNSKNYKIKYVQPFDMFPQTKHVETLAVLEQIKI